MPKNVYPITWTQMKAFNQQRNNPMTYYIADGSYIILMNDGQVIFETMFKDETPTPGGSDQEDFENNFQSDIDTNQVPIGGKAISLDPDGVMTVVRKGGAVSSLSSIIPLAASGSFIPALVAMDSYEGITVILNGGPSNATGTLFLDFSEDGVSVDRTTTIPVSDLSITNPRTLAVISSYFRARYINDGVVQTTFKLQTHFHASKVELTSRLNQSIQGDEDVENTRSAIVIQGPDTVFRNVKGTNSGDMGTAIFDPQTGVPALVTPSGALKTSEIVHLAGDVFGEGPLATNKWDVVLVNSGTIVEANGELVLDTNGVADADARLNTFTRARFYPGHFNTGHLAAQLSDVWASADTVAEWGVYDATNIVDGNGIFIRFTNGEFNIVTRINGVETVVNESSFTQFIPTKNDQTIVYEIGYNAGTARFFQGPNIFHQQSASAGPFVGTPHLKVGARLYNINGSSEAHDLRFRALGIYRVGRPFAVPDFIFINAAGPTTIKDTPGTLHRIVLTRVGGGGSTETITLHDGPTALDPTICEIAMTGNGNQSIEFEHTFNNGLTLDSSSIQLATTVIWD